MFEFVPVEKSTNRPARLHHKAAAGGSRRVINAAVVNFVQTLVLKRKLVSLSHRQELGQLADLASDRLFTLV